MPKKRESKDQPYIENYPVLADWLEKIDARPDVQFVVGDKKAPRAFIERWFCAGGAFFVLTHEKGRGWDVFTSMPMNDARQTLADAEQRLKIPSVEMLDTR